jgi:hypothetical protein
LDSQVSAIFDRTSTDADDVIHVVVGGNKIGLDVAIEALRPARQRKRVQNRELLRYAKLLRVEKPISPYLQAIE